MPIVLNGGLATLEAAQAAMHPAEGPALDGVMLGRAAYQNPEILLGVDPLFFGTPEPLGDAFAVVEAYLPYVERRLSEGVRLNQLTRHILGLFPGRPGARLFRRHLATEACKPGAGPEVIVDAVAHVRREMARREAEAA